MEITKVKKVTFGGKLAWVVAEEGRFMLFTKGNEEKWPTKIVESMHSKAEMIEYVEELYKELIGISTALESDFGVFKDIGPYSTPKDEPTNEEATE